MFGGNCIGTTAVSQIVCLLFTILTIAIFARAILSWFNMDPRSPLIQILNAVTEPIMEPIRPHAAAGGLVFGICNGFQVLTEAGLLPGVLRANASLSFVCRDVPLTVTRADTPFTSRCTEGQSLTIPVKHGEGCWFADDALLEHLASTDQIALRYAEGANPNGAIADVAGVLNEDGNVFGLMPHPEHAVDALLGSTDGALILGSLVDAARLSLAAVV